MQNGYKLKRRDRDLAEDLNLDELSKDFDFSTTLESAAVGNRALSTPEDYEDAEKPASERNFRNDENIISDPNRCTSWVKPKGQQNGLAHVSSPNKNFKDMGRSEFAVKFVARSTMLTENGGVVPILSKKDKERYLEVSSGRLRCNGGRCRLRCGCSTASCTT